MTNEKLWKAVGAELATTRTALGLTWADVERRGGPAAPTVRDNERGKARTIVALRKHTRALRINLIDVLTLVIDRHAGRPTITPALAAIVRRYERTTPEGRIALQAVSDLCPEGAAQENGRSRGAQPAARRAPAKDGRAHSG